MSSAANQFEGAKVVAPILVLKPDGGVISYSLDTYIASKKSANKYFVLPIAIRFNDQEYISINASCSIFSPRQFEEIKKDNNGGNYVNFMVGFFKKESNFIPTILTACDFEDSDKSTLFLSGLPKTQGLQMSLYILHNPTTLAVTGAISINNAGKRPILYFFTK